ncbi:putative methyltransferase YqeM [Catellatospora sp. TT07R-123]|uniref:class I SAM-dependent DNA methyltransferase n=1 Tax=Catellatospora sp. TT07R-123 TaxID=2733863 RepID=UPI001B12C570|nr:class I SAM-dependent methyltransferase [Catellatospora sp. TT07R-123]GHJ45893.1 putative methyltransferase YqeM [Catellatospora sp. TT07R-123]
MSAPYGALAKVYDRWVADNDYQRWVEFILDRLPSPPSARPRVLDVCCGTGTMAGLLTERGCEVTGVDACEPMLEIARRAAPKARFVRADVPDMPLGSGSFDVAICTFDSLNYLVADGMVSQALRRMAEASRPGALLVFDVNTQRKLHDVFADTHYGDDLDDFAYVWRNHTDAAARTTQFDITLFTRKGGAFTRESIRHHQRWFDRDELAAYAADAMYAVEEIRDDYGSMPATEQTLRETWVLRRK